MEEKTLIRKRLRVLLCGLSEQERRRQENEVTASLLYDDSWKDCSWVFGFLPMAHEFDLEPLLKAAIASGKRLALPRVEKKSLKFHEVRDLEGPWILHPYGMREPGSHSPVAETGQAASEGLLVIVPGLAFDRRGYRIGYGGGFYDRLLSGLPDSVLTVSCLYREQLLPSLPVETQDRRVQRLFVPGQT